MKTVKKNFANREMIFIGLMAAVLAVLSQVALPLPVGVPLTLQTMAVALCGALLGWRSGLAAVGRYLLLGAVGLPVYSAFRGGFGILFGVTGGFLWGFLLLVLGSGLGRGRGWLAAGAYGLLGLVLCHACGVTWYSVVTGSPWTASFLLVSAPFLLKDAASLAASFWLGRAVERRLHPAPAAD